MNNQPAFPCGRDVTQDQYAPSADMAEAMMEEGAKRGL